MVTAPSHPPLPARSRNGEPAGQHALERDVTTARLDLEERYLALNGSTDASAVDELDRVRKRLHRLAEIHGEMHHAGRDAALRAWLRGA